jgi:hypothetical protein
LRASSARRRRCFHVSMVGSSLGGRLTVTGAASEVPVHGSSRRTCRSLCTRPTGTTSRSVGTHGQGLDGRTLASTPASWGPGHRVRRVGGSSLRLSHIRRRRVCTTMSSAT